jgi:hypothetical protein
MQPGQFFTEYLDAWSKTKRTIPKSDLDAALEFNTSARREGIVFALPYGGIMTDRNITKRMEFDGHMMRPPYPVCIFEFVGDHKPNVPMPNRSSKRVVVVFDRGDYAELMATAHRDVDGKWMAPPILFQIPYDQKGLFQLNPKLGLSSTVRVKPYMLHTCAGMLLRCNEDMERFYTIMAADFGDELWAYLDFCRTVNNKHIVFDDVVPDKAKNKMRRALGKVPLFTYKVLTIGKKKRKSANQGGTHASPRSHLRRGYYRTSRNGVRHWVQPCMVKGETDGFVHKDYKVEGTVMERLSHGEKI